MQIGQEIKVCALPYLLFSVDCSCNDSDQFCLSFNNACCQTYFVNDNTAASSAKQNLTVCKVTDLVVQPYIFITKTVVKLTNPSGFV